MRLVRLLQMSKKGVFHPIDTVTFLRSNACVYYKHMKADAFVVSYPKSGRTWLRVLLAKYLSERYELEASNLVNVYQLSDKTPLKRTLFTHMQMAFDPYYEVQNFPVTPNVFLNKPKLFITRQIRDILVSHYFHITKRYKTYDGDLSDFIRSDKFGVRKIAQYLDYWGETINPENDVIISYENMKIDTMSEFRKVLAFLGEEAPDEDIMLRAVEFSKFDKLKKLEKGNAWKSEELRPGDVNDKDSYKVRRGLVSGYHDYMTKEDLDYIDEILDDFSSPFIY